MTASYKQKKDLFNKINSLNKNIYENDSNEELFEIISDFEKRLLCCRSFFGIFMLCIVAFLFYYSVGFCQIYPNSQNSWIFSGILSLVIIWIVLAPIYIFIISLLEKCHSKNSTVYNIKRLFFF